MHVSALRKSNHSEVQKFLVGYQGGTRKNEQMEELQELIDSMNDEKANKLAVAPFGECCMGKLFRGELSQDKTSIGFEQ